MIFKRARPSQPITIQHWPRAIAHIDGDSFFASVEQALNPALKGKPVVTGAERGIVTAASYEAKALGITRGMRVYDVSRLHPECVIVSDDYNNYSLFSKRMMDICRQYTPDVEEYSIDEAFLDLTGLRRRYHHHYPAIGRQIQDQIQRELGITVSVGISLSKSLAKLASKKRKPHGLTAVPGIEIHTLLNETPVDVVWGFGPNSSALLNKHGMHTALDVVSQPVYVVERLLGKVGREIWHELRGEVVYPLTSTPKNQRLSISRTRTFTPPTSDMNILFAHLLSNLEEACQKAARFNLVAGRIIVYLKKQTFSTTSADHHLQAGTNAPLDLTGPLKSLFFSLYERGCDYRATGVILADLVPTTANQLSLFQPVEDGVRHDKAAQAVSAINTTFGKRTVVLGDRLLLRPTLGANPRQHPLHRMKLPLLVS